MYPSCQPGVHQACARVQHWIAGRSGRHARARGKTTATGTATQSERARTRPNDGGRCGIVPCVNHAIADDCECPECDWGSTDVRHAGNSAGLDEAVQD
jgi:hypothetical protein